MIREERDAGFWQAIADHPDVAPNIYLTGRFSFDFVRHPEVTPLACIHGGFLYHGTELHALFRPEGWGHEVAQGLKLATEEMIRRGADSFTCLEVEGLRSSRPPRSHGWKVVSGFARSQGLWLRSWALSVADWRASPAFKRMPQCPHS